MVRRRWLLSWLPESGEPDNLDEWARSNLYLIPQKPQKQLTFAAAQQQRYASRWPPARPGRPPVHGMPQGSPYGRFGKSFPPNLPAPLERREEEEREQVRLQFSVRELAQPNLNTSCTHAILCLPYGFHQSFRLARNCCI